MSGQEGVVRSSALSFLAGGQVTEPTNCTDDASAAEEKTQCPQGDVVVPVGLQALCAATARLYPSQPNPLQVTTRLKYWLGGHDPLDYISMYWNQGNEELDVPPHWHYVSFGLSDLHGDGRVHPPADRVLCATAGAEAPPSGYGLELTFRLRAPVSPDGSPAPPPLWPASLLQHLARYIFTTGNKFCAGDHVSWHAALDGHDGAGGAAEGGRRTRVRHLLVAEDPQLGTARTPLGTVTFLQMLGCTGRELRAAQRGSGFDVLQHMAKDRRCGGAYLVTDPTRRRSAHALRGAARGGPGLRDEPAQLAGVSARLRWLPYDQAQQSADWSDRSVHAALPRAVQEQIRCALQRGLSEMASAGGVGGSGAVTHMSVDSAPASVAASGSAMADSFEMSSLERALPVDLPDAMGTDECGDSDEAVALRGVHLQLNPEGAALLPLALLGRVAHSRHFTWRDACGSRAVTLVAERVGGAFVTPHTPYAAKRGWLQMLIPSETARQMAARTASLASLADTDSESEDEGAGPGPGAGPKRAPPAAPHSLHWPHLNIRLTIMPDHYFY